MRQAYVAAIGRLQLRKAADPEPGPGEVTVRIRVSLSCGTDVKTWQRGHAKLPVPGPLGHEAAGEIHAVGPGVEGWRPGDPVMWVPTAPCGSCKPCDVGLANHCETLFAEVALGAHADLLRLPGRIVRSHLFPRPVHLHPEEAALLEPLACVVRGQRRLGDVRRLLVIGAGPIALLHVAVARALGVPEVWLAGNRRRALEVAGKLGATRIFAGYLEDVWDAVMTAAGPWGLDAVAECTGQRSVWEAAPALVRPGGKVLLFGGLTGDAQVTFSARRIHYHEVTLLGAFHYTPEDVRQAYELLAGGGKAGRTRLGELISHRYPLDDVIQVFQELGHGWDGIKAAFYPDAEAFSGPGTFAGKGQEA